MKHTDLHSLDQKSNEWRSGFFRRNIEGMRITWYAKEYIYADMP